MLRCFVGHSEIRSLTRTTVVILALSAFLSEACTATAIAQTPESPRGSVQGTVLNQKSGQPLSGVTVRLAGGPVDRGALQKLLDFFATRGVNVTAPAGEPNDAFFQSVIDAAAGKGVSLMNPEVQNAFGAFEQSLQSKFVSVSDGAGHFSMPNVVPGNYDVITESKGHFGPGSGPDSPGVHASVKAGDAVSVQLPMIPGAVISGHVSNPSGRRLPNMSVQAFVTTYQDGYPILQPGATTTTDDQGEYKLFWLPPGEYVVATMLPRGRKPPPVDGKDPVRTFYPQTTDVLMAQPVSIRGGEELAGFDIEMQMARSFKISGEIISAVAPPTVPAPVGANVGPTTATISIMARDPSVPDNVGSRNLGTVQLSPSGDNKWSSRFEVQGILPGVYDISTWVRESNPDGGSSITIGRTPVEVRDQDLDAIELRVYPSVRVLGKVTLDGHAPGTVATRISVQPEGSEVKVPVYQGIGLRAVMANPQDGAFMVPAVTSGQFRVQANQGLPPNVYVADVRQAGVSVYDSGFSIAGKTPDLIEVVLRSGSATVEGTVKDAAGKPMSQATVVLVPPVPRRSNRSLYKTVTTDAEGHFSIKGVAPENYQVYAWQSIPADAFYNARFLSKYQDRGHPVYVTQDSTVTASLTGIAAEAR